MNVVKITPRMAELWLKHNHVNRNLDIKRVKRYAREMVAGRWLLNPGAVISFSTTGALIDGQHRLSAIVEAKVPISMYVATNVEGEVQVVMDKGRPRKVSDNLHMFHGVDRKYASKVSTMSRYILAYELGIWEPPNEADALDVWNRYEGSFRWLFEIATALPWNKGGYYGAPMIFAHSKEPVKTSEFHEAMVICRPHADKTPMAALFKLLSSPKLRTGGMKGFQMSLIVLNALCDFVIKGESAKRRNLYISTVGFDELKRRWGMTSKRGDGSCSYQNCPCTPMDSIDFCWIHKNWGSKHGKLTKKDQI
jgi:hypothetical protein